MRTVRLIMWCSLLTIFSCEDVILKDISNETPYLMAPQDNFSSPPKSVTFWWEEIDGATGYQLLIVSPTLESANLILLDSVVTKDKFSFTLAKGSYQWCVRGVNSGYETAYQCRNLEITD